MVELRHTMVELSNGHTMAELRHTMVELSNGHTMAELRYTMVELSNGHTMAELRREWPGISRHWVPTPIKRTCRKAETVPSAVTAPHIPVPQKNTSVFHL
jgi:hypothetical protein